MTSDFTITERIEQHFSTLSKSQQKVAHYVLKHLSFVVTHSAAEVGVNASTSETTVIRFCYAIGLSGYAQLQKEVTLHLLNHNTSSSLHNYLSSKEALFTKPNLAESVMSQIGKQMTNMSQQVQPAQFEQVTKRMHEAASIYLVGAGASQFAAQWLQYTLNILRPNVHVVDTGTVALIRTLEKINQQTLVIVVSLHRYYKQSIAITKLMKEHGARVVAITDTNVAPIHQYADDTFVLQQYELSTIDMMPALIAFMNTLVAGMMAHDTAYYNEQQKTFDAFRDILSNRWS